MRSPKVQPFESFHPVGSLPVGPLPIVSLPIDKVVSELQQSKPNEDIIRDKIARVERSLRYHRRIEDTEVTKSVGTFDKIYKTKSSCFEVAGSLVNVCSNLELWRDRNKHDGYIAEAICRHEGNMMEMKNDIAIKKIENQIKLIDENIENVCGEGDTLIDYACISYGEMAVTIVYLNSCLQRLKVALNEEVAKIMQQRREFKELMLQRVEKLNACLQSRIRDEAFEMMDPKIQQMDKINGMMRESISEYKDEIVKRKQAVTTLSKEIKMLKGQGINIKKELFPELFSLKADCKPDTILVLDIPTRTNLKF